MVLLSAACSADDISVYQVPKESPSLAAPTGPGLRWSAPDDWTPQAASGMRLASYRLPDKDGPAEMTVIVLEGPAGGLLANANRWRGQLGLGPLDEKALRAQTKRVPTRAGAAAVVDFAGKGGKGGRPRILAAVIEKEGSTWFFKVTGAAGSVGQAKARFLKLIGGLHDARQG